MDETTGSMLTTAQGKQKGSKGDVVRQKDQGYGDAPNRPM